MALKDAGNKEEKKKTRVKAKNTGRKRQAMRRRERKRVVGKHANFVEPHMESILWTKRERERERERGGGGGYKTTFRQAFT